MPLLNLFESSNETYVYKASHRWILLVLSTMFTGLSLGTLLVNGGDDLGYYLPVLIFGGVGLVGWIVGFLGTDRAVAKLWGSR